MLSAVNTQNNLLRKAEFITYCSQGGQHFDSLSMSRRRGWWGGLGVVYRAGNLDVNC